MKGLVCRHFRFAKMNVVVKRARQLLDYVCIELLKDVK